MNMGLRGLAPQFSASPMDFSPVVRQRRAAHDRLKSRLREARFETDRLFALLRGDALLERPAPERQRLIFYLGHLEAFDWNLLGRDGLGLSPFEPDLDDLFTTGLDHHDLSIRPATGVSGWPSVPFIRSYSRRVRSAIDNALDTYAFGGRIGHPGPADLGSVELAIEHRLLHAEVLATLIQRLPPTLKKCGSLPSPAGVVAPGRLIPIAAGPAALGLDPSSSRFAWDHEYGAQVVDVDAFSMASRKVTNGDFLKFVDEGGYTERRFWSAPAWAWLRASGIEHPELWVKSDGGWKSRAMFGDVPFQTGWPVCVSQAEAEAFARFKGGRLPTEAEYHRAAFGQDGDDERAFPWGDADPWPSYGAFGFSRWDFDTTAAHPAGDTPAGISELMGNGWEWTSSAFTPFQGYEASATCHGASTNFLDGKHYVLKGGSHRTATALLRRSFRIGLLPEDRSAYSTFRYVV